MSVPPNAAPIKMLRGSTRRGSHHYGKAVRTDLESAVALNDALHKGVRRGADLRIDHFLGRSWPRTSFAGLATARSSRSVPQFHRPCADRRAGDLDIGNRIGFYEQTGSTRHGGDASLPNFGLPGDEPPTSSRSANQRGKTRFSAR
jgi:hypothetical protein